MTEIKEVKLSDFAGRIEEKVKGIKGKYRIVVSPSVYPETYGDKVLDTFENLKWLLDSFNIKVHYNLMSRRREIVFPDYEAFNDDIDNSSLARINYLSTLNYMPTNRLDSHLEVLSHDSLYHPIVKCIQERPWDGVERLQYFLKSIKTEDDVYSHQIIKTWMVCAIAAAHSESGFINQGVLVLQGKQNLGKTRFVKALDPINCGAVQEGAILDPSNKDNVICLARHWIVELGELDATFNKSDIARLKSYITMQADTVRFPYAVKETKLPRRTAYIATVNDDKFLYDDTGNRRWWTISVNEIDLEHGFNMQQVWAEAYCLWKAGHETYLSKGIQDTVNKFNEEHEKVDPLREKLLDNYDWESVSRRYLSPTKVLEELGLTKPNRSEATKMGVLLKELSKNNSKVKDGYRLYSVPYLINKSPRYF
jgi:putative DNA primase/helicase